MSWQLVEAGAGEQRCLSLLSSVLCTTGDLERVIFLPSAPVCPPLGRTQAILGNTKTQEMPGKDVSFLALSLGDPKEQLFN